MKFTDTKLEGVKIVECFSVRDERGSFTKLFHAQDYRTMGMPMIPREIYFSESGCKVIRGMHFQVPPWDHEKVVSVLRGSVMDVIVDLRRSSPTYGENISVHLSADDARAVYIPKGFAHGFCSLKEHTLMLYQVSEVYHRECDTGIAFDSIGYDWGIEDPVISQRDRSFVRLEDFDTPFS